MTSGYEAETLGGTGDGAPVVETVCVAYSATDSGDVDSYGAEWYATNVGSYAGVWCGHGKYVVDVVD